MFITFEGCEGTGKTTQAKLLEGRLQQNAYNVALLHEPGFTSLGKYLRNWLRDETKPKLSPEAELFLFAAARNTLVKDVILPLVGKPKMVVISDRFIDSTTAYQGYGRNLNLDMIDNINKIATGGLLPNITFLLDAPVETGLERTLSSQLNMEIDPDMAEDSRRIDESGTRKFENESDTFHSKVRNGYLEIAKTFPERIIVIDAKDDPQRIAESIWDIVEERFEITEQSLSNPNFEDLPLWSNPIDDSNQSKKEY